MTFVSPYLLTSRSSWKSAFSVLLDFTSGLTSAGFSLLNYSQGSKFTTFWGIKAGVSLPLFDDLKVQAQPVFSNFLHTDKVFSFFLLDMRFDFDFNRNLSAITTAFKNIQK